MANIILVNVTKSLDVNDNGAQVAAASAVPRWLVVNRIIDISIASGNTASLRYDRAGAVPETIVVTEAASDLNTAANA